jgi:hypothetical protein
VSGGYADNDGRFPAEARVQVRYPARFVEDGAGGGRWVVEGGPLARDGWPWLPAEVLGQCGPDEWHLVLDVEDFAEEDEDGGRWYPACFRDASEIRHADVDVDSAGDDDADGVW